MEEKKPFLLIAEDDPDDRLIIQDAVDENEIDYNIHFVNDGQELIDYLSKFTGHLPKLIILDLNMPKIDGREALKYVKTQPRFKMIPTIILTTSSAIEDIKKSYDLGVNSFIIKPSNFSDMVKITNSLSKYWFNTVQLPT